MIARDPNPVRAKMARSGGLVIEKAKSHLIDTDDTNQKGDSGIR